ncbi:MAG: type I-E CRISPR-associated protein Cas5/CasD [Cyanobacteriota bacterium]|nr:type I-E CRISPR-associated protein Cas5/CasD [Cyanobacteriota bacterium]
MPTLLLRLAGPLQSWGRGSRFDSRDTDTVPTQSGVIGLIASAMGIKRYNQARLAEIARLHMGVLIEREGKLLVDYHTAMGAVKADGTSDEKETIQSQRQYLCDAEFLVGLESNDEKLLRDIEHHLCFPTWQPFLGRKSCPPSKPIFVDLVPTNLQETFDSPTTLQNCGVKPGKYRLVIQSDNPQAALRLDVPVDFEQRIFSVRTVITQPVEVPDVSEQN